MSSEMELWRFSCIAPLLHPPDGVSLYRLAQQLAAEPKIDLEGTPRWVSTESLLRWLRRYRQHGVDGLAKRIRSDRGRCRALDGATIEALMALAAEHPEWTVKALHRHLQRQLGEALSLKPCYRLLQGRVRTAPPEEHRHRPPGIPQLLWFADTWHGPVVYGPRREKRQTYVIALFDDASRAVMASAVTYRDDVLSLMPVLHEAIQSRGLPQRLLVDNGANYRSRVLRTAVAQLGFQLLHSAPYQPTAKARLERFWGTAAVQLPPRLPAWPTFAQLQTEWARFCGEYHETPHRALTAQCGRPTTPLAFYLHQLPPDVVYPPPIKLDDLLLIEVKRRVNADATIRVAARSWEVQPGLVGQHVLVRYNPHDVQRVLYRPSLRPDVAFTLAFPVR